MKKKCQINLSPPFRETEGILPFRGTGGKILQACKPDSVLFVQARKVPSFIWDKHCCLPLSAYPPNIGRAALWRWYIWHFSTQGLPDINIPVNSRELLPHVFTFSLSGERVVIFCGTVSFFLQRSPAVSRMRCSVLSGLSYPLLSFDKRRIQRIDSAACSGAKLTV